MRPSNGSDDDLRAALVRALEQATPDGQSTTDWVTALTGLTMDETARVLTNRTSVSVDLADAMLRICCETTLLELARRSDTDDHASDDD